MDEAEQLSLTGLAKIPSYQSRFKEAAKVIRETYKQGESHVAFSVGKDSSVVLHLCQQVDPNVPALFCSTEQKEYMDNYDETIEKWRNSFGANIKETMLTPYNWRPNRSIRQIIDAPKTDTSYLGLRKSESKIRRISLSRFGVSHNYAAGGRRVCPISNWTDLHVWAYIAYHNLPYLSFYDSVPKTSPRSRTSVFLGTGHAGTALAVESRVYAGAHNYHFAEWESQNEDVVRLMRCYWELNQATVKGTDCYKYLDGLSFPVPENRIKMFHEWDSKKIRYFRAAKTIHPYLSMAAWVLYKRIHEVTNNESIDEIIDLLRPQ